MKATEFRKLIREEVRKALKENTITLGSGRVIKNVVVDNSGIKFGNKSLSFEDINDYFSTKPGKEGQMAKLFMDSELLQRLAVEAELGISDEEGVADVHNGEDPKLAGQIKMLTNFIGF